MATPERWVIPHQAVINSLDRTRVIDITPNFKQLSSKEGEPIGQVLEATVEISPGDMQASLDFTFKTNAQVPYDVLTNGWQSWSSSVVAGQHRDQLIGMRPYDKSLGGTTVPFFEPGPGGVKIPQMEGRGYGWVGFRDAKGGDNSVLGITPSFDSVEDIRYRQEGTQVIVSARKNLEGVTSQRPVTFKVFLGHADRYADLMMAFSEKLSKLTGNVPLMKDRVIGFSWPTYGTKVTQTDVKLEIEAG